MEIKAVVFDMDGTILHSVPDLAIAANEVLAQLGYPTHTEAEVLAQMGSGSRRLIDQLLPEGTPDGQRERVFGLWREVYIASDYSHTAPFPGVISMLHALRARGVKTAVLSNKFDEGVRSLTERFFPGLFDLARGELPPMPRKPDPTSLMVMLGDLGVQAGEAAYVGDTIVDVEVARNAGVRAIGVSWGYDSVAPLPKDELDAYIRKPDELVAYVDRMKSGAC